MAQRSRHHLPRPQSEAAAAAAGLLAYSKMKREARACVSERFNPAVVIHFSCRLAGAAAAVFFIIHDIIIHGSLRLRLILCCLRALVQVSVSAAAAAAAAPSGAGRGFGDGATIRSLRLELPAGVVHQE